MLRRMGVLAVLGVAADCTAVSGDADAANSGTVEACTAAPGPSLLRVCVCVYGGRGLV